MKPTRPFIKSLHRLLTSLRKVFCTNIAAFYQNNMVIVSNLVQVGLPHKSEVPTKKILQFLG